MERKLLLLMSDELETGVATDDFDEVDSEELLSSEWEELQSEEFETASKNMPRKLVLLVLSSSSSSTRILELREPSCVMMFFDHRI